MMASTPARSARARVLWIALVLLSFPVAAALVGPIAFPGDPFEPSGPPLQPPSPEHWFGTDDLGRDLFRAIVHGARASLAMGAIVTVATFVFGLSVGSVAGYRGGWSDEVLSRFTEAVQVMPRFFLAILALALFGASWTNLTVILALTSWPGLARIVRAAVLVLREALFVDAALVIGRNGYAILLVHVLPNAMPSVLPVLALVFANVLLMEAGLSYLGIGDPNRMSWGLLIYRGQANLLQGWWLTVFPGVALIAATLGLALLALQYRNAQACSSPEDMATGAAGPPPPAGS